MHAWRKGDARRRRACSSSWGGCSPTWADTTPAWSRGRRGRALGPRPAGRPEREGRRQAGAALATAPDAPQEAQRLANGEVADARAWGAPGALGRALRVAAVVGPADARHETLLESEAVLRTSVARLQLAQTLCELGALERRAKHRAAAREP